MLITQFNQFKERTVGRYEWKYFPRRSSQINLRLPPWLLSEELSDQTQATLLVVFRAPAREILQIVSAQGPYLIYYTPNNILKLKPLF